MRGRRRTDEMDRAGPVVEVTESTTQKSKAGAGGLFLGLLIAAALVATVAALFFTGGLAAIPIAIQLGLMIAVPVSLAVAAVVIPPLMGKAVGDLAASDEKTVSKTRAVGQGQGRQNGVDPASPNERSVSQRAEDGQVQARHNTVADSAGVGKRHSEGLQRMNKVDAYAASREQGQTKNM